MYDDTMEANIGEEMRNNLEDVMNAMLAVMTEDLNNDLKPLVLIEDWLKKAKKKYKKSHGVDYDIAVGEHYGD